MTKARYSALIKAELTALKDIEKEQKWMHIALRSAEERHAHRELSSIEMARIQEIIREQIIEVKSRELAIMKRIATYSEKRDGEA